MKEMKWVGSSKVGKGLEQTFPQRRYTNGRQEPATMLNITNHEGTANQNYSEIPVHTHEYGRKTENMGKLLLEPLCTVGRSVKWYRCSEKQFGSFSE